MNKNFHVQKIVLAVIMALILMTGCRKYPSYDTSFMGGYSDLCSMAVNSLIGTKGYMGGEVPMPANIKIIEEDDYGRKLFIYYEGNEYSLLISQKSDEEYVYFYPDYNFIITLNSVSDIGLQITDETIFAPEEIEKLKEYNDWDKKIDMEKCIKVEIVDEKGKGPIEFEVVEPIYYELLGDDSYDAKYRTIFLATDDYGRSIYEFYGTGGYGMIALIRPDGTYDEAKGVMKLMRDEYNYQDKLKRFKELNDWNSPIQED